jgi:hypothetical protein
LDTLWLLVVEFVGECGIDTCGLRKELLNMLLDLFEEGFDYQQDLFENGSNDSNEETSKYTAGEKLYAYGLCRSSMNNLENFAEILPTPTSGVFNL